ncbi:hypothetical protein P9314_13375 [Paenibacillus validus]|uniref:Uncharacterized protein n=1 Tax=Paenibacillus validus TaxID=44253 RepID=A0A7X2ZAM1_9BACL|nr:MULTISPECIES: hypothetical protein [Paenibacillus]MED4601693.1 hypothetical protein [Paenibacillus validus]MED4606196.1 hypothetical protein [Paenibacillus validus]MUG70805.1 hypothetical protein [Paenibacillus validus]
MTTTNRAPIELDIDDLLDQLGIDGERWRGLSSGSGSDEKQEREGSRSEEEPS